MSCICNLSDFQGLAKTSGKVIVKDPGLMSINSHDLFVTPLAILAPQPKRRKETPELLCSSPFGHPWQPPFIHSVSWTLMRPGLRKHPRSALHRLGRVVVDRDWLVLLDLDIMVLAHGSDGFHEGSRDLGGESHLWRLIVSKPAFASKTFSKNERHLQCGRDWWRIST